MKNVKKLSADVVIVGSGPGGATLARDLILKGKKVIIVEWGKNNKPRGNMRTFLNSTGGMLGSMGKGIMITPEMLIMVRAITVGGTTMFYTGTSWDPLYDRLKKFGVDLDPKETENIKKECHVGKLPENFIGPAAKEIMRSAKELGYKWDRIDKFIDSSKGQIHCKDTYCGDKHKAKWEAYQWVMEAKEKGATLLTEMHCDNVIVEKKTATGVLASDSCGRQYEISGKAVVIAAGGVGTPVILQRSGIFEAGKKFFFDPFILTYGFIDKKTQPGRELAMTCGMHLDEDGIVMTDITNPWFMSQFFNVLAGRPTKFLKTKGMATIMIKARDVMDGTVSIAGRITKPLTFDDRSKLNKGCVIATQILQNLGAKDIWYGALGAAHPGGTCRIGTVVNKDLETEYKNLYVSDGSVIPFEFGLPPVLTIMCLSRRLSKHLLSKVL